jgi:hypothetical protein
VRYRAALRPDPPKRLGLISLSTISTQAKTSVTSWKIARLSADATDDLQLIGGGMPEFCLQIA